MEVRTRAAAKRMTQLRSKRKMKVMISIERKMLRTMKRATTMMTNTKIMMKTKRTRAKTKKLLWLWKH